MIAAAGADAPSWQAQEAPWPMGRNVTTFLRAPLPSCLHQSILEMLHLSLDYLQVAQHLPLESLHTMLQGLLEGLQLTLEGFQVALSPLLRSPQHFLELLT
jgi:hypothetical protein